jgi:hypothetical protein
MNVELLFGVDELVVDESFVGIDGLNSASSSSPLSTTSPELNTDCDLSYM